MKKEYKLVAAGCLWGFMEGNVEFIADSVNKQLKMQYDIEPEVVKIYTHQPYVDNTELKEYTAYPVITISMRIDGVSWSITRDTQSEFDRGANEDIVNIKQLIEEGQL